MAVNSPTDKATVNWKQVLTFLGLTFGLTYLMNLILFLYGGFGQVVAARVQLQIQMLVPATVAMVLQLWVFRDSPIYQLRGLPRWFFYFYLGFVGFFVVVATSLLLVPDRTYQVVVNVLLQLLLVVGLVVAVVLRLASGKEAFQQAGLSGGKVWHYLLFALLIIVVFSAGTALDAAFGLGEAVDVREFLTQAAAEQATGLEAIPDLALLLLMGAQTVVLGPVLALLVAFGEEYGWRGYLQGELIKLGKVRGIALVGVIWGLWHAPAIAMGHNYPGHPILGIFLMTLMTVGWGFVLGYAVLKSKSVWLAALLHGLLNQTAAFLMLLIYRPADTVYSFTIGLPGLAVWAAVVGLLFVVDRKEWTTPVEAEGAEPPDRTLEAT
jgi:membrane protease YdiL (CAAX protease family)